MVCVSARLVVDSCEALQNNSVEEAVIKNNIVLTFKYYFVFLEKPCDGANGFIGFLKTYNSPLILL